MSRFREMRLSFTGMYWFALRIQFNVYKSQLTSVRMMIPKMAKKMTTSRKLIPARSLAPQALLLCRFERPELPSFPPPPPIRELVPEPEDGLPPEEYIVDNVRNRRCLLNSFQLGPIEQNWDSVAHCFHHALHK